MNWYKKAQDNSYDYSLDLETEAKKHNSPESFIKSMDSPFFHGTGSEFDEFDIDRAGTVQKSDWGKGIYLTRDRSSADYYRIEAIKKNDKLYNDLYNKYDALVKKLPPVSSYNSTPAYTQESRDALKAFQDRGGELNKNEESGRVVEVFISPQAKIIKFNSSSGMTDPYLAESYRSKGYDAIIVDEGLWLEEIVILNSNMIKTKEQLVNIWKKVHASRGNR